MTYYTNEGKTYCVVGTADGTVTSASGVVIASFSANEQNYFTSPAGGFVTISDDTAIVTPVFDLAPSALVGKSSGGDSPSGGDYSDWCGYIEYDDETGAIVDLSIPKYITGNLTFKNEVFPENYEWKFDMPYLADGQNMFNNCTTLRSFSGDLSALIMGFQMFKYCSNLTEWNIDLPALTNGQDMFNNCTNLTSFEGDLSALTIGQDMFNNCTNLISFEGDLSALTSGYHMFYGCSNLSSWTTDLPNLTSGTYMFYQCTNFTSWTLDLPNLTIGESMFSSCYNLRSFSGDLSSLTNGFSMFNGCILTEWNTPLPKLTNGEWMFRECTNFTSFSSDLSSLTKGNYMFYNCKLDAASVERILSTIPTYTDGSTHQLTLYFSSEAAAKFEEITGVTPTTSEQTVSYKGWTIYARING